MRETLKTAVSGHVLITDNQTGEVLVDKFNAIHPQNMATAIARGLANTPNHQIFKIKFGNGGTFINSSQKIEFQPPNTTGQNASLYRVTYEEVVDEQSPSPGAGNSVVDSTVPLTTDSRVIITAVISANEAVNNLTDQSGNPVLEPEGDYFFDELGLFTGGPSELMLSHLIFSPIEHTGNREITVVYTLTISVS